jgi:hypothetical protein
MTEADTSDKWHEFSDPENKLIAYVNLHSKEFSYKLPPDVKVEKDCQDQFLEILDELTERYYYLDVKARSSSWKKPESGIILPASLVQVDASMMILSGCNSLSLLGHLSTETQTSKTFQCQKGR